MGVIPKRHSVLPSRDGLDDLRLEDVRILTKDYDNIPVKDMEAWVNQSAEIRQLEVEKRKGKIAPSPRAAC